MSEIKNILVAIDLNDTYGSLMDHAESLSLKFGSKLWVVHVAEPDPDFVGYEPGPQYIRDFKAEEFREEHRNLQTICDSFLDRDIKAEALLIQGSTVETLLDEAKKLAADLLIIGTHEHSFLQDLFSESVSLKLFKRARIPILAIPIGEEKSEPSNS